MNEMLTKAFKGINCLSLTAGNRKMVLSSSFDPDDTTSILVIPFTSGFAEYRSSAYSDIKNRFILINPSYIVDFAKRNTLNDSTNMVGLVSLMLLHELGHFITGINGSFDGIVKDSATEKRTGEMKMDTEPEYLTTIKRMEMKVDSIAISLIKGSITSKNMDCYGTASDIQLLLPGMSFQMFGMTMLKQFGKQSKILRDPSSSHPNMELRIAFMNYFLSPTDQLKQMIDEYIYNREIAPIERQQTDPRIFQGQEKILPEDKK